MSSAVHQYAFTTDEDPGSSMRKHHRRTNSKASTGSDQSLTYSASSSVQSHSTAGESTDSSFAEIMRVIEDDTLQRIVGEMHDLPKTIPGQPSNSQVHDGGGMALFERANPAEPTRRLRDSSSNSANISQSSRDHNKSKRDSRPSPDKIKRNSTPPPPRMPIQKNDGKQLWYSQLWMCGFADSLSFSNKD